MLETLKKLCNNITKKQSVEEDVQKTEADRIYDEAMRQTLNTSKHSTRITKELELLSEGGQESLEEIFDGLRHINK